MNPDVLIVGAGPVGLTTAAELTRYGLKVRIIDQTPEPTDKSKALVVWPRTLEHLDRLGLASTFVSTGLKATHGRFFARDQELAAISLNIGDTPFPFALMIPQSETERLLTEHLASVTVTVERPVKLTAVTVNDTAVTVRLTGENDRSETLTTPWLIACDGAHSTVRHALNAPFEGDTLPSSWVLADVHLSGPISIDSVEIHLHSDGILGLFPISSTRFRVIANTQTTENKDPTLADIQTILDQRDGRGLQASNPIWLAAFQINERKIANFRHNRIFLAGDAAHIHSPAGGQGMNTGMQDAFNLAWKLTLTHRNLVAQQSSPLLLDSYNAERSPVAAKVLKGAGALTRMATLDNALLRSVRNSLIHFLTGFDVVQQSLSDTITELAISYPDSPLNGKSSTPHGTPKPGERAPIRTGESPVSTGDTPRFALYAEPGPDAEQFIDCFPQLLEYKPRPPFAPASVTLVRPDGYVAFSADTNAWVQADAYMTNLIYGPQQKVTLES